MKRLVMEDHQGMENQWALTSLQPGQVLVNPNVTVRKVKPTKPEIRMASNDNFATKMYAKELEKQKRMRERFADSEHLPRQEGRSQADKLLR